MLTLKLSGSFSAILQKTSDASVNVFLEVNLNANGITCKLTPDQFESLTKSACRIGSKPTEKIRTLLEFVSSVNSPDGA